MPTEATPIDDPNVKIPTAIKATIANADEIHRQVYAKPDGDPPAGDPPAEVTVKDPPATPATPAVTSEGNEPQGGWEHAFKSMKGRFERERDTSRALSERIANLENVIAALPVAAPADPANKPESLLTPKDVEDYGEDFLTVVGKKAKEIISQEVVDLRNEVAALKQNLTNVGQTVSLSGRDKMKATLSEQVPDWQEINTNQEFLDWLRLPDEYSGAIRHNLLKEAWGRNETARVAAFFKGFLAGVNDQAREAVNAPANTKPDRGQGVKPGKIPLETFAAPGRAKSAADTSGSPAEKPIFTRAQITEFYRDVAAGKWRGREKEQATHDQQIIAAGREGRIR